MKNFAGDYLIIYSFLSSQQNYPLNCLAMKYPQQNYQSNCLAVKTSLFSLYEPLRVRTGNYLIIYSFLSVQQNYQSNCLAMKYPQQNYQSNCLAMKYSNKIINQIV